MGITGVLCTPTGDVLAQRFVTQCRCVGWPPTCNPSDRPVLIRQTWQKDKQDWVEFHSLVFSPVASTDWYNIYTDIYTLAFNRHLKNGSWQTTISKEEPTYPDMSVHRTSISKCEPTFPLGQPSLVRSLFPIETQLLCIMAQWSTRW